MKFLTNCEFSNKMAEIPLYEHIRLFTKSQRGKKGKPIELEINWSAPGTVGLEEAKDFAKDLKNAIHYVEVFNNAKFTELDQINFKNLSKEHLDQEDYVFSVQPKNEDIPCPWDNVVEAVDGDYIYIEGNIAAGGIHLKSKCTLELTREDAEALYELHYQRV